jgi:L-asparaginase/Glu-tRNA(Gln) amidotransferase subunit D
MCSFHGSDLLQNLISQDMSPKQVDALAQEVKFKKEKGELGVVVHACDPRPREAETGRPEIQAWAT